MCILSELLKTYYLLLLKKICQLVTKIWGGGAEQICMVILVFRRVFKLYGKSWDMTVNCSMLSVGKLKDMTVSCRVGAIQM